MWNWFQENAWIFTLASILVGAAIAVTIYNKNKRRKTLDWELKSDTRILSHTAAVDGQDVKVMVGDEVLNNPRMLTYRFKNTGNVEIMRDDFLRDITLPEVDVISVSVNDLAGIQLIVDFEPEVKVAADCLNPGEHLQVKYLVDNASGDVVPDFRVKGATRPPKSITTDVSGSELATAIILYVVLGGTILFIIFSIIAALIEAL